MKVVTGWSLSRHLMDVHDQMFQVSDTSMDYPYNNNFLIGTEIQTKKISISDRYLWRQYIYKDLKLV